MTTILSLLTNIMTIINGVVVPLIFTLAFLMFLVGILRGFFLNPEDPKKREEGKKFALWALIAFFIMFSVWGLVNVLFWSFGLNNSVRPAIPTFGDITTGTIGNILGGSSNTSTSGGALGSSVPGTGAVTNTATGLSSSGNNATSVVCPSGSTYQIFGPNGNSGCFSNSTGQQIAPVSTGPTSAVSGVPKGGSCNTTGGSDGNCAGALICTNGSCQADPQLENGDGTLNSACKPPGDCDGAMVCDVNTDTCQNPGTPGVSDGGLDSGAPADGSVAQGGSCAGNENACDTGTCNAQGVCAPDDNSSNCPAGETDTFDGSGCQPDGSSSTFTSNCPSGEVDTGDGSGCQPDGSASTDNNQPQDTSGSAAGDDGSENFDDGGDDTGG